MAEPSVLGEQLRRYRVAAGLAQEELAERAGVSARAVSDLERGVIQTPRKDTLHLLAEALALGAEDHAALIGLRRPGGAVDVAVAPATAAPALLPPAPAYTPAPGGAALPVGMLTFARNDRPLVKRCSACIAIQPVGVRCSSYSDEHLPLQSLLASDRQKG